MAVYEWKAQESSSCSVHEASCLGWSSVLLESQRCRLYEVGSCASEGMDVQARRKQANKEQKLPSSVS